MKHGFMLIELIIATLIASMIVGILLTALSQGSRFQIAVDNIVDTSLRIGIVSNQLEKDLMGAFVPVQAERGKKGESGDADEQVAVVDEKKTDSKKIDEKKSGTKEKKKPLEKIFYSTNKEGNCDQLTFITNNPLVVFVGKDVGVVKPKIVRVHYVLKPEVGTEHSYALYRQESLELDLAQPQAGRQYEIIGGIKSFSVVYTARIEKKQEAPKGAGGAGEQAAQQKEQPKVSYEYKTSKDWVSEQKKEDDKQQQEAPRIPYSVEIKIVLWDKQNNKDKEFTVVCEIPVDHMSEKQQESQKQPEPSGKAEPVKKDDAKVGVGVGQQPPKVAQNSTVTVEVLDSLTNVLKNLTKMLG